MAEHHAQERQAPVWGVAAGFDSEAGLLAALAALSGAGLGRVEAFAPTPLPGAADMLELHPRPLHRWALAGAALGGAGMFGFCCWVTLVSWPMNVGGRPVFSWPSFVVPSLSCAALGAAAAAFVAMLLLNRLPRLNHPAFNIADFARVSADRYVVAVVAQDASFDEGAARALLARLRPMSLMQVKR